MATTLGLTRQLPAFSPKSRHVSDETLSCERAKINGTPAVRWVNLAFRGLKEMMLQDSFVSDIRNPCEVKSSQLFRG
jgi:hypothetical protein